MAFDGQLNELRAHIESFNQKFVEMVSADDGKFYPLDLLAIGALNRSHALLTGFVSLIEAGNFVCAAPLVRLQLDNALRLFAAWLVDSPHEFAHKVLKGEQIRKLKDRDNQLMTDFYLTQKLNETHNWVSELYRRSSGFVHLSEKHIFSAISDVSKEDRTAKLQIGISSSAIPDMAYLGAIDAMKASTDVFLEYIDGWILTKNNPELTEQARKEAKT